MQLQPKLLLSVSVDPRVGVSASCPCPVTFCNSDVEPATPGGACLMVVLSGEGDWWAGFNKPAVGVSEWAWCESEVDVRSLSERDHRSVL